MLDWLAAQAQAQPRSLALAAAGQRWSYAALDAAVNQMCRRLQGLGLAAGQILASHLGTRAEMVVLIHAAARMGLPLLALNTRLSTPELAQQLAWVQPSLLVCEKALDLAQAGFQPRSLLLEELAGLPEHDFTPAAFALERLQGVIFTSGTSGSPKGAQLTFGNHFWSALGSSVRLGMLPGERWLSPLPLYHVGGVAAVFRCCLFGAALELSSSDPGELAERLAGGATLVSLVPTLLARLLQEERLRAPDLRLVLLGGAAAAPALIAAAHEAGLRLALTYGLTEACSQVCTAEPGLVRSKPGTVGKPLLYTQLAIVDAQGRSLGAGEIGEVTISGPTLMAGYFGDPSASQQALRQGWLFSGDLGYLDEEGDLWLVQRRSDLIVSGGENVYPAEVEPVLLQHAAVAEACVVGKADAEWGQAVAAAIVLKPGAGEIPAEEIIAFCRTQLAGYKIPRHYLFLPALPQTASGKIARQAVRELFEAARG